MTENGSVGVWRWRWRPVMVVVCVVERVAALHDEIVLVVSLAWSQRTILDDTTR